MAEDFEQHVIDLITFALQSTRVDLVRAAARALRAAPKDGAIPLNITKIIRAADAAVRTWIFQSKPGFEAFRVLMDPLVDEGVVEGGWNVFDPAAVAGRLTMKAQSFLPTPLPEGFSLADTRKSLVPVVVGTIFSADVVEVTDKQLWIREEADVEPCLLRGLACRKDIPLPCLTPTARALLDVAQRVLAHEISRKCGLAVPLDLGGISVPPPDRARSIQMPKGAEVPS